MQALHRIENTKYRKQNTKYIPHVAAKNITQLTTHTQNSPKNKQIDRQSCIQSEGESNMTDRQKERDRGTERCSRDTGDKREKHRNSN